MNNRKKKINKMYPKFRTDLRFMRRYGWLQTFLNCVENSLRRKFYIKIHENNNIKRLIIFFYLPN